MNDIVDRLARIETKIDGLIVREDKRDERLSAVERKQWYHSGVLAAVAFLFSKFGFPTA
jgi:hypothetical protein